MIRLRLRLQRRFHPQLLSLLLLRSGFLGVILACAACATSSDEYEMGSENTDWYAKSNADPASFGITDGFSFNKKQKVRSANDLQFYYKRCALDGGHSHYSRTSYWCNDPF